jgi:DNA-binding XRE family transcriptional regulator
MTVGDEVDPLVLDLPGRTDRWKIFFPRAGSARPRSTTPSGTPECSHEVDPLVLDLARRRMDRGLSQRQVATKLGITQQRLSLLERGRRDPRLSLLRRWQQVLQVDTDRRLLP